MTMKMRNGVNSIPIAAAALLSFSVELSAHAGFVDRAIQARTSKIACSATVIAAQITFGILFLIISKSTNINRLFKRTSKNIVSNGYVATVLFWLLLTFSLAPYLTLASAIYWIPATLAFWLTTHVMCFSSKARKICTNPNRIYYLLIFSILTIIGYIIYSKIYSIAGIQQLFSYVDDLYPGLLIYPEVDGIRHCIDKFIEVLFLETIPIIVCLNAVRKMKGTTADN